MPPPMVPFPFTHSRGFSGTEIRFLNQGHGQGTKSPQKSKCSSLYPWLWMLLLGNRGFYLVWHSDVRFTFLWKSLFPVEPGPEPFGIG